MPLQVSWASVAMEHFPFTTPQAYHKKQSHVLSSGQVWLRANDSELPSITKVACGSGSRTSDLYGDRHLTNLTPTWITSFYGYPVLSVTFDFGFMFTGQADDR